MHEILGLPPYLICADFHDFVKGVDVAVSRDNHVPRDIGVEETLLHIRLDEKVVDSHHLLLELRLGLLGEVLEENLAHTFSSFRKRREWKGKWKMGCERAWGDIFSLPLPIQR